MATYYVSSVDGNDADNGSTWDLAKATFGAAVTAATSGSDIILVSSVHTEELAADTTYTFTSGTRVYCVDRANGDALTTMGESYWIGNSTTNRYIRLTGTDAMVYIYGLTFRCAGSTLDLINVGYTTGGHFVLENCLLWHSGTTTGSVIQTLAYSQLINCQFKFGSTGQYMLLSGNSEFHNCTFASSGSVPTVLLVGSGGNNYFVGCDFSTISGTLVGNSSSEVNLFFDRCLLHASVTRQAAQTTNPTKASAMSLFTDCHSGDTHMEFAYYDGLGEVTKNGTTYYTSGAAGASWKIVTNANVKPNVPFTTPWIDLYNTGTSAITPYFECLRNDGTATKWTDADVYAEFTAKTTSGSTKAIFYDDRVSLDPDVSGTAQADGAGTSAWTIASSNSPASFKCDAGESITPQENGYIRGRIVVTMASKTIYVDPQIRT